MPNKMTLDRLKEAYHKGMWTNKEFSRRYLNRMEDEDWLAHYHTLDEQLQKQLLDYAIYRVKAWKPGLRVFRIMTVAWVKGATDPVCEETITREEIEITRKYLKLYFDLDVVTEYDLENKSNGTDQ
ncbi:Hypothetical protein PBC10988_29490 [Planctomycetales bacterium 10988]|nr:Hypothetical protein PBC10988_29490 [Planctomycetales bacterium 10988]